MDKNTHTWFLQEEIIMNSPFVYYECKQCGLVLSIFYKEYEQKPNRCLLKDDLECLYKENVNKLTSQIENIDEIQEKERIQRELKKHEDLIISKIRCKFLELSDKLSKETENESEIIHKEIIKLLNNS